MKFSRWKDLAREDERGMALGTVILLVSGFALVSPHGNPLDRQYHRRSGGRRGRLCLSR